MDNNDKNPTSNFDMSTLIDEAATQQNHYRNV
jgi:hypothetical protein